MSVMPFGVMLVYVAWGLYLLAFGVNHIRVRSARRDGSPEKRIRGARASDMGLLLQFAAVALTFFIRRPAAGSLPVVLAAAVCAAVSGDAGGEHPAVHHVGSGSGGDRCVRSGNRNPDCIRRPNPRGTLPRGVPRLPDPHAVLAPASSLARAASAPGRPGSRNWLFRFFRLLTLARPRAKYLTSIETTNLYRGIAAKAIGGNGAGLTQRTTLTIGDRDNGGETGGEIEWAFR